MRKLNVMEDQIKRRTFLENAIRAGAAFAIFPVMIQSCKSEGKKSSETGADNSLDVTSCDDLSKVPEAEIKKREGFAYVNESPMPDKHCKNCNLYLPPREGQACGGCALFKGPVFEEGYCTYWAPIV